MLNYPPPSFITHSIAHCRFSATYCPQVEKCEMSENETRHDHKNERGNMMESTNKHLCANDEQAKLILYE